MAAQAVRAVDLVDGLGVPEASPAPHLSLVVPMYRERRRIRSCVERLGAWSVELPTTEFIFVDDGSDDGTSDALTVALATGVLPRARSVRLARNAGKGAAVRTGMFLARGDWAGYVDADLSVGVGDVVAGLARLDGGTADVVYGVRDHELSVVTKGHSVPRKAASLGFRWVVRALGFPELGDSQCGLKLFATGAIPQVFGPMLTHRFAFDLEILHRAVTAGLRIEALPVTWHNGGDSSVRAVRDAGRMFWDVCRIRWATRGGPFAALTAGGS